MNKLFRPKTMRRMAVFMALVAPIVYLFGSLFFALNGAHGQEVFAEPVYTEQYVEVDNFVADGSTYRFTVSGDDRISWFEYLRSRLNSVNNYFCDIQLNSNSYYGFNFVGGPSQASWLNLITVLNPDNTITVTTLISVDGNGSYSPRQNSPWVFVFSDSRFVTFITDDGILEKSVLVPTSETVENAGAYSDYIFKNFFAKDNFLVQWGENAISEDPYGFAPFGYFWRYLDNNVLHLSNEQVGLMGYGYMYYAAHVLLFDVGFILVTFFLTFIQKVADKIGGEDHA